MMAKKKTVAVIAAAIIGLGAVGSAIGEDESQSAARSGSFETEFERVAEKIESEIETGCEPMDAIMTDDAIESERITESEAETEYEIFSMLISEEREPEQNITRGSQDEIEITYADSGMTAERIAELTGVAVFWAPTGEKVHCNPECRTFKRGYTFAGTLEQARTVRSEGWCGICSKKVTYAYATAENLAECYTYEDFCAGIPDDAFK